MGCVIGSGRGTNGEKGGKNTHFVWHTTPLEKKMSRKPTLLGHFSETDAIVLTSTIAGQIDTRFLTLDLSQGSRIYWKDISLRMSQVTRRTWQEAECQRLWRFCAYGEDIGSQPALLPDSDGEDDALKGVCPKHFSPTRRLLFSVPHFQCTSPPPSLYLFLLLFPVFSSRPPLPASPGSEPAPRLSALGPSVGRHGLQCSGFSHPKP